jgi:hypothetical protein
MAALSHASSTTSVATLFAASASVTDAAAVGTAVTSIVASVIAVASATIDVVACDVLSPAEGVTCAPEQAASVRTSKHEMNAAVMDFMRNSCVKICSQIV